MNPGTEAGESRRPESSHARGVLALAVAFGLAAGLGELGVLAMRRFTGPDLPLWVNSHVVWMAPAAGVLLCIVLALPLLLASRLWPDLPSAAVATAIFAFVAIVSIALGVPRIHPLACAVIAAGVAARLATTLPARRGYVGAAERLALRGGLATLLLGAGFIGALAIRERITTARLAAAPAGAPNIVLLILDTVRAFNMSLYGYERATTPELEQLAGRGTLFVNAFTSSPWTLPSHAGMFTGRLPHELSTSLRTPLDDRDPTVAEVLRANGYRTAGFVANQLYAGRELGLGRGFTHYEDMGVSPVELPLSLALLRRIVNHPRTRMAANHYDILGRKNARRVNRDFLRWLDAHGDGSFFAFLNYFDAHEPYMPPAPWDTLFGPQPQARHAALQHELRRSTHWGRARMSAEDRRAELDAYDGAIAWLDHEIGALVEALETRGLLDNTVVIITSDHGEQFGEHDVFGHGGSLYTQLLRVPLLVLMPGQQAPHRVEAPVSLVHLAATLLDLAGVDAEAPPLPGSSFAGALRGSTDGSPWPLVAEREELGLRSVMAGPFHLILRRDSVVALYDVTRDPAETVDLFRQPGGQASADSLRALFNAELSAGWREPAR